MSGLDGVTRPMISALRAEREAARAIEPTDRYHLVLLDDAATVLATYTHAGIADLNCEVWNDLAERTGEPRATVQLAMFGATRPA